MSKTNELLKEFEELCKFVREIHGDDTVCGYCEYDCGTVGGEPMECPGFETDECFKLKEEFKKRYLGRNRMKAILVIEFEESVKELVSILIQNGYKVSVTKTGYWWEHKYQVEVSKDESNHNT